MDDSTIERVWKAIIGLGLGILFVVLNILLNMSVTAIQTINGGIGKIVAELLCCLLAVICVSVLLVALKKLNVSTLKFSFPSAKTLTIILIGLVLYRLLVLLCSYLMLQNGMGSTANDQMLSQGFNGLSMIVILFIYAICTPVMEEAVFRGGIIGFVFKEHQFLGLLLSSIIFTALHNPTEIYSWLIYGGFSLIVGYAYLKTNQLSVPITIHILNNLIGIIGLIL